MARTTTPTSAAVPGSTTHVEFWVLEVIKCNISVRYWGLSVAELDPSEIEVNEIRTGEEHSA